MDKPVKTETVVGVIHYAKRENYNSPATQIHPNSNNITGNMGNPTSRSDGDVRRISHTVQSPRTDGQIHVAPTNILPDGGPTIYHHQSNQHVQQNDTSTTIDNPQPSTSFADHTGGNGNQSTLHLRNKRHASIADGPARKSSKKGTSPGAKPKNPNLEREDGRNTLTHPPSHPGDDSSTYDTTDTNSNNLVYTFIIHKPGCPLIPPTTRRGPTFAAFDHGDDYHFIYTTRHTNNASRALNSIIQFINAGFEGTTEANTTLQLVRFHRRFISYLIRKGIRTFHKYENRTIGILSELTRCLLQYNIPDDVVDSNQQQNSSSDTLTKDTILQHCAQYTEDKKTASKEAITQRTFSIDFISNLITTHKITSYESFQRTLSTNIKIQLLKQLGYVGQNIIKTLIKIHRTETLQTIKHQHYYTLINQNCNIQHIQTNNIKWLSSLFDINNIDVADFFAHFLLIHSTDITKINTFILKGPTTQARVFSSTYSFTIQNLHALLENETKVTTNYQTVRLSYLKSRSLIRQPSELGNYFSKEPQFQPT
jgi:hypothetical protein